MLRRQEERLGGCQPHDLGTDDRDAGALRFRPDAFENAMERRLPVVGHIDRHLNLFPLRQINGHRLDEAKASADVSDRPGDALRDGHVPRPEIDVVGDQRRPSTDRHDARGRMRSIRPKIRLPLRVLHFLRETLEFSLPDFRQVAPPLRGRGVLIQKDRNPVPLRNLRADLSRELDTLGLRGGLDRNQRHDIDGAHAGVLSSMAFQVDPRHGRVKQGTDPRANAFGVPHEGQDAAVMGAIRGHAEEPDAGCRTNRLGDLADPRRVLPFRDVRHTLDDGSHRKRQFIIFAFMSSLGEADAYPGNPSLPREVREKILSTFRHTLNLFHDSKLDDCLIGCDFILKMDPRFTPARRLMDKARNPNAQVDIQALEAIVAGTLTRQARVVAAEPERLLVRAVESFSARDFDAAMAAAQQVLAVLPGNQDAREILDRATRKKAAQPLFDASRQRAIAALDGHRLEEAHAELGRMRSLDPDHPAVALLERRIGTASPSTPVASAPDLSGLSLDLDDSSSPGLHAELGSQTSEPAIAFDDGATMAIKPPPPPSAAPPPPPAGGDHRDGGLNSLSLDLLSLDLPPAAAAVPPPPPDFRSPATGPLATPRGSPADMWSETQQASEPESIDSIDLGRATAPPPPVAPTPAPPEDDAGSAEHEIAVLLKQGDEAAKKGDRQQAIEVWSRIFLIDINNSEAVTRIEKARQEMAEGNRLISDCLKAGREKFEAGDLAGSRELFLRALAVDKNEPTARFYLDRIEEELARLTSSPAAIPTAGEASGGFTASALASAPAFAATPRPSVGRSVRLPSSPKALAIVAVFLAMTIAGVCVFRHGSKPPASKPTPASSSGSLQRARQLLGGGQISPARAELRRIPVNHPDYGEAQKMLAELGKPEAAPGLGGSAESASLTAGVAPAGAPQSGPAKLRAAAEKALAEKRYIEALKNFNLAAAAFRNDLTFAQAMGVAQDKVNVLTPAVRLYNEAEYETAIPILWRIYQEDRENQDARSFLLRAYYNQGVTHLQNGLYPKALQAFNEALTIHPSDPEALRHRKFAERYQKGDLDLMGRIYVRHLNHRP